MKTLSVQWGLGDDSMISKFDATKFNATLEHGKIVVSDETGVIVLCVTSPQMFYEICDVEIKTAL